MKSNDPLSLFDEENSNASKKVKKKKKKKHKHKDKNKERDKNKLDFSNTQLPGVSRNHLDDRLAANSPLAASGDEMLNDNHKPLDSVTEMMKEESDFSDI